MFRYKWICADKERVLSKIEKFKTDDLPCGKSLFGGDLYGSGIHFQTCGEEIKGFYLTESENEPHRGAPIRIAFSGRFEDGNFVVSVYPNPGEVFFLTAALTQLVLFGEAAGLIIAIAAAGFFVKWYHDMMKETCDALKEMIAP